MSAKHTPGPWRVDVNSSEDWSVDYDGPSSSYVAISGQRKQPVAFAVEPKAFGGAIDANARLIAAAPKMFDALRPLVPANREVADEFDSGTGDDLINVRIPVRCFRAAMDAWEQVTGDRFNKATGEQS